MKKALLVQASAAVLLLGCVEGRLEETESETAEECTVQISFSTASASTKSALFKEEYIQDINFYIWRKGKLVQHEYAADFDGDITLPLVYGTGYSFYAVANCGKEMKPEEENWMLEESSMETLTIPFTADEKSLYPLYAYIKDVNLQTGHNTLHLKLERLVSRVRLKFSPDLALNGSEIRITGVRMLDAAASVKPFIPENRAESGNLVAGDYASEEDLEVLNSGGSVDFYVFENCWGELLPDNTEQKDKVPGSFGNIKGPTYLEVSCTFPDNRLITGSVTYRIFPGLNATSNFDLVRNTSCNISLFASKDGLGELSWRIDNDTGFNNGLADLDIVNGHSHQELYLGEVFKGRICNIDTSVLDYFGGDARIMAGNILLRCTEEGCPDPVTFTITGTDGESILVEGTCRQIVSGAELWICDKEGNPITELPQTVSINKPLLVLSSESHSSFPSPLQGESRLTINGESDCIYVYLCDIYGHNMLSRTFGNYNFDTSVINLNLKTNANDWQYAGRFLTSKMSEQHSSNDKGTPWAMIETRLSNDGMEASANTELWKMVRSASPVRITVEDPAFGLTCSRSYGTDYFRFKVHFCDSYYGASQKADSLRVTSALFLAVENRSKMSFTLTHLTLAETGRSSTYSGDLGSPQHLKYYFYNCPDSLDLPEDLFMIMAEAEFKAANNVTSTGCRARVSGTDYVMEINGTFVDLIKAVQLAQGKYFYKAFGYEGSVDHYTIFKLSDGIRIMTDLRACGEVEYDYSIELENGGQESNIVYDGYPPRWAYYYSNGRVLPAKDTSYNIRDIYSDKPDVNPMNISALMAKSRDISYFIADPDTDPYYAVTYSGTVLNTAFPFSMVCEGRCETHPRGQSRDPVIQRPTTTYDNAIISKATHSGTENLTKSGIYACFNSIFNFTYTDYTSNFMVSSKKWQHHAHPQRITLYPDVLLSSNPEANYLWNMSFTPQNVTYDNPAYDPTWDNNPYSVTTTMNFRKMHEKFTHRMIVIR